MGRWPTTSAAAHHWPGSVSAPCTPAEGGSPSPSALEGPLAHWLSRHLNGGEALPLPWWAPLLLLSGIRGVAPLVSTVAIPQGWFLLTAPSEGPHLPAPSSLWVVGVTVWHHPKQSHSREVDANYRGSFQKWLLSLIFPKPAPLFSWYLCQGVAAPDYGSCP